MIVNCDKYLEKDIEKKVNGRIKIKRVGKNFLKFIHENSYYKT